MSEQINFNHENNEIPTRDEVLDAFVSKRELLQSRLDELDTEPGFKKDATDKIYERRDRRELTKQLEGLNEEWYSLGGEAIEEANAAKDALNFKSDALDHVRVNTQIRDAKDAFYESFLASEEIVSMEAEESAREAMLDSMPAATKDPTNVRSNKEVNGTRSGETETTSEPDIVRLPNGMVLEVRRVNGKLSVDFVDTPSSRAEKKDSGDTTESNEASVGSEPEAAAIDTRSRSQKAFGEAGKFIRNPFAYMSARMNTARAMKENGESSEEKKGWRKKALAVGLGAAGLAGAVVLVKHGMSSGGNAHGQAADLLPQSSGNHNGAASEALAAAPAKSTAHIEAGHDALGSSVKIHRGEGFYEVFQKAGIPEKDWHATMDKVGPDLAKKGLAYWDKAHNEYRISGQGIGKTFAVSKGHIDLAA